MEVLHSIAELETLPGPVFLAIGVFDGVHLGHQAVISTSAQHAHAVGGTPAVVTFDPHPVKVLRPNDAPRLITATEHKIALIRALGVEHLLVVRFDRQFAQTPPELFVEELVAHTKPLREICVGHEWSFGKNRAGNLDLLRRLGERHRFEVVGIPPVRVDGVAASSTAIRAAIERGDFDAAAKMLGRDYTIVGTVVPGDQVGRRLGFRTANISAHSEQFPPNGVYIVDASFGGQPHHAVANVGVRPTFKDRAPQRLLELHLLDFDRDIYGAEVEVRFVRRLRDEMRFDNVDALKQQIAADVQRARELRPA